MSTAPKVEIAKPFTAAEKEQLIEVVSAAQAAVAAQDKWIAFLRKQHDAPVKGGWDVSMDGFIAPPAEDKKEDDNTSPAPAEKAKKAKKSKAPAEPTTE